MKNPNTNLFWDRKIVSEENKLLNSPIYLDKNKTVLEYLRNAKGKLLNIGIGYGHVEVLLNNKYPNLKLYGLDISSIAIKLVKSKAKGRFLIANALKIPFKNDKFDYVLALDVLEHFSQDEQDIIFKQLTGITKKKGILIISVPLNESISDKKANRHMVDFTEVQLFKVLANNGFSVLDKKFLYAFENLYSLKSLFARYLRSHQPNLLIVKITKK